MRNGNVQRIRVLIASLVAVIAAMADVYIIVNAPKNYILLAIVSAVLLVAIFFLVSGKMQLRDLSSQKAEEQYQNIVTSQKACYLQARKKFRETGEMLGELDKKIGPLASSNETNYKKISGLLDSLMEEQKKVAKLTLSRSKENANALMNSNDKVMEEMAKVQEVVEKVLGQPESMIVQEENKSEEFGKIEEKQQELLTKMQALEDSLNNHMDIVVDKVQEIPEVGRELIEELKSEIRANEQKQTVIEEQEEPQEEILEETELEEPELPEEELTLELELDSIEEETSIEEPEVLEEEPTLELELDPIEEETSIEEPEVLEEEPILELQFDPVEEETSIEEPEVLEEEPILELQFDPVEEETSIEEPELLEETNLEETESIEMEEVLTEETIPEVETEAETVNTNAMMTPEEIAALIAGSQEEELPEIMDTSVEEESSIEETVAEDTTPSMPDLSDPNQKMSPEDIAALIANL